MKKVLISLTAAILSLPLSVAHGVAESQIIKKSEGAGSKVVLDALRTVAGWVSTAFYIAAAIYITLAAFKYLTGKGDAKAVGEAKNALIYAIVAVAVAAGVTAIITLGESFSGEILPGGAR